MTLDQFRETTKDMSGDVQLVLQSRKGDYFEDTYFLATAEPATAIRAGCGYLGYSLLKDNSTEEYKATEEYKFSKRDVLIMNGSSKRQNGGWMGTRKIWIDPPKDLDVVR